VSTQLGGSFDCAFNQKFDQPQSTQKPPLSPLKQTKIGIQLQLIFQVATPPTTTF